MAATLAQQLGLVDAPPTEDAPAPAETPQDKDSPQKPDASTPTEPAPEGEPPTEDQPGKDEEDPKPPADDQEGRLLELYRRVERREKAVASKERELQLAHQRAEQERQRFLLDLDQLDKVPPEQRLRYAAERLKVDEIDLARRLLETKPDSVEEKIARLEKELHERDEAMARRERALAAERNQQRVDADVDQRILLVAKTEAPPLVAEFAQLVGDEQDLLSRFQAVAREMIVQRGHGLPPDDAPEMIMLEVNRRLRLPEGQAFLESLRRERGIQPTTAAASADRPRSAVSPTAQATSAPAALPANLTDEQRRDWISKRTDWKALRRELFGE